MKITILSLFPEFFQTPLKTSMIKRAQAMGAVEVRVINIRDFATDKHKLTDDSPYGGGAGMVMKIEPIDRALNSLAETKGRVILTSAKGKQFIQQDARRLAALENITIIAGHYEGVDERVAEHLIDEELRIGDYVLTGGETAGLVMIDAIVRLLPGVLGNQESLQDESHDSPGQLSYPQFTRPEVYKDWKVPEVLLSGDHAAVKRWRAEHGKIETDERSE